ncbi:MAG: hypothetical protein Q4C61_16800 [Lachnospiraceae bacterium]|nr:hypothetical protein [Lachnospiraceae bacterium]
MKQKKFAGLFAAFALALTLPVGYGNTTVSASEAQEPTAVTDESTAGADTEQKSEADAEQESEADENQAAAQQLLLDLQGTYQELWPVVLADEYRQVWLDASAELVGEENAEGAVEKMASMVTGTVTGEEAVEAYKDGNMAYCCDFLQDVEQFTFDGTTISGVDEGGNELFSHSYHYVGMEEIRGLYVYESDDADSGEFTYFCMAPDTMETTWHIEFRYGSDLEALGQYDAGEYAYWLASGISVDHTEEDAKNSIILFCTENLSE